MPAASYPSPKPNLCSVVVELYPGSAYIAIFGKYTDTSASNWVNHNHDFMTGVRGRLKVAECW